MNSGPALVDDLKATENPYIKEPGAGQTLSCVLRVLHPPGGQVMERTDGWIEIICNFFHLFPFSSNPVEFI